MSGVNAELMRLLFPAYVELITLKAGEQRQAALLSGKATASDIAAGVALGRAIAAVFVARAASDGMRRRGRFARAVGHAAGPCSRPRRHSVAEHGRPGPPADAAVLRQRPGVDADAGADCRGTSGAAALDIVSR